MPVELLHLPYDIPVAPIKRVGYAPSVDEHTALLDPFLDSCGREQCSLRGRMVPSLLGGSGGLHAAARLARSQAVESGRPAFGYLFHVELDAMIALPSPSMAATLAGCEGDEIWDSLRPLAEAGVFDGVHFERGLIIFQTARDRGSLLEEFKWRIKSDGIPQDST